METPAKYVVDKPRARFGDEDSHPKSARLYPAKKKEQVLMSAYFQCVRSALEYEASHSKRKHASTADSMIMAGKLEPGREEELIDEAIAFTDKLIKQVGEKM
jgi:hypothetical protein